MSTPREKRECFLLDQKETIQLLVVIWGGGRWWREEGKIVEGKSYRKIKVKGRIIILIKETIKGYR